MRSRASPLLSRQIAHVLDRAQHAIITIIERNTRMAAKKKKAAKKPAKKAAKKPAKKVVKKAKTKRKPNAAFMKPVTPNEKLAAVVGASPLPRTEGIPLILETPSEREVVVEDDPSADPADRRMIVLLEGLRSG